ncbi:YjfB family protein [Clostridium sp. JN-9]|uniref:YjfB family protein n=1 Tax=Clostridium sp. JN-9 TaxID=2507159 RepID=UPI000FFE0980|nr:YjfB family protein [Clostridium sp. JN-9]QAT40535.1 putative motility protein [Clostridium sp. JN-9]
MDIAALSMVMSQSRVKESVGIALMKKAMDIGEQNAAQMTEMMKNNVAADPNLGQHLDVMA